MKSIVEKVIPDSGEFLKLGVSGTAVKRGKAFWPTDFRRG